MPEDMRFCHALLQINWASLAEKPQLFMAYFTQAELPTGRCVGQCIWEGDNGNIPKLNTQTPTVLTWGSIVLFSICYVPLVRVLKQLFLTFFFFELHHCFLERKFAKLLLLPFQMSCTAVFILYWLMLPFLGSLWKINFSLVTINKICIGVIRSSKLTRFCLW